MNALIISVGSTLLILLTMGLTLLVLSVALCRARAKLQGKLKTPARQHQDQIYEEANLHHQLPVDVETQPNVSYASHRKL